MEFCSTNFFSTFWRLSFEFVVSGLNHIDIPWSYIHLEVTSNFNMFIFQAIVRKEFGTMRTWVLLYNEIVSQLTNQNISFLFVSLVHTDKYNWDFYFHNGIELFEA